MRKVCHRIILSFTAVSCFWLGALSGGNRVELPEKAMMSIRTAAKQALDLEQAEQYLQEKLPILLTEIKNFVSTLENDLFFGQNM